MDLNRFGEDRISKILKNVLLVCLICAVVMGISDSIKINNKINGVQGILSSDDYKFSISNNMLDFQGKEKSGFIGDIQYYITDKYGIDKGRDLRNKYISNEKYIIFLKDGVCLNAGVVGMNSSLNVSKSYSTLINNLNIDNDYIASKILPAKIGIDILIVIKCIVFLLVQFFSQSFFITLIIYAICLLIKKSYTFLDVWKAMLYSAILPQIIITISNILDSSIEIYPIMFVSILVFPFVSKKIIK